MKEYPYLPLSVIKQYEDEMREEGVSNIARGRSGFLTMYKRVGGNPNEISPKWKIKRDGFIKRHLAQYKVKPTRRRKLALIAWAYMPR